MIFSLGSNGSGQLGTSETEDVSTPTLAHVSHDFTDVKLMAAGGNHTLLLDRSGRLFAAGDNSNGKCAFADKEKMSSTVFHSAVNPLTENVNSKWKMCSATWEASTLVSDQYEVYACGNGNRGELGLGEGVTASAGVRKMRNFPPPGLEIVDLAACMSHTVAVLSNGDVYGWGSGKKGQLGNPSSECWQPRKFDAIPFKARKAACGRDFTCIVGSPVSGELMVLGGDKWKIRSDAPTSVDGWRQIGASWGSAFVLLESGELLSWGRNDHGQLAPPGLPAVEQIAVGSEHALVLLRSGQVLAWGWGEHGNCGEAIGSNGDVKGRWNCLSVPHAVTSIGAGCATSWIFCKDD